MQWPKNQVRVMASLFWNPICGIFIFRTTKQMTFLEFWDKTGQDRYLFKRKFWFLPFELFWPEVDLTGGQMWRVSPSNSMSQMTQKHVSHDTHALFSYGDLIWPDLDLYLALVTYLRDIFVIPSVAFSQILPLQLSLASPRQPIRRKESALTFDLTLTQHLTLLR